MQIGVETSRAVENKRVFIVHSDEITRAALQFMLHDENESHELASLSEAYAKSTLGPVDLLLLDISIASNAGKPVFREIAEHLPGAKILLVTESSDDTFAKECLKSGANGILAKPIRLETVRHKVDVLLGRSAAVTLNVLS